MRKILLTATLLTLAACTTPAEREAARIEREQADIEKCIELGFKPKTDAFADCRLRMVEMRQSSYDAARIRSAVGFGWGSHGWRGRHFIH